jgi:hypothetical protein
MALVSIGMKLMRILVLQGYYWEKVILKEVN